MLCGHTEAFELSFSTGRLVFTEAEFRSPTGRRKCSPARSIRRVPAKDSEGHLSVTTARKRKTRRSTLWNSVQRGKNRAVSCDSPSARDWPPRLSSRRWWGGTRSSSPFAPTASKLCAWRCERSGIERRDRILSGCRTQAANPAGRRVAEPQNIKLYTFIIKSHYNDFKFISHEMIY